MLMERISEVCYEKINIGKVSHNKLMKVQESIFKDIFINTKNILSEHIELIYSYNLLRDDYRDDNIDASLELIKSIDISFSLNEYNPEVVQSILQDYLDVVEESNRLMYDLMTLIKNNQKILVDIDLSELEDKLPSELYNKTCYLKENVKGHRYLKYVVYKTFDSVDNFAKGL